MNDTENGPVLLNDHQVEILDGKIQLRFAGTAVTDLPRVFDDEEEAAACLAETIRTSKVMILIGTVSCGAPAAFGRPDFVYPKFVENVMGKLRANGSVLMH